VSPHGSVHFTLADVYNREHNPKGGCSRRRPVSLPGRDLRCRRAHIGVHAHVGVHAHAAARRGPVCR